MAKAQAEESTNARELYAALSELYARLTRDLDRASGRARARRATLGETAGEGRVTIRSIGKSARYERRW